MRQSSAEDTENGPDGKPTSLRPIPYRRLGPFGSLVVPLTAFIQEIPEPLRIVSERDGDVCEIGRLGERVGLPDEVFEGECFLGLERFSGYDKRRSGLSSRMIREV